MKTNLIGALVVAGALATGVLVTAQTATKSPSATTGSDPRISKLLEQNEQILKNQQEILQKLETISGGIQQLRRRSS